MYDRYSPSLYGIILQVIPEEERASEVLVKLYVHIFRHANQFHTSGQFTLFGWLMKTAREFVIEAVPPSMNGTDNAMAPMLRPKAHSLVQFAGRLTPDVRQIFDLCYCKGLSQSAVASVLGMPEEEVSLLFRSAMVELRKFMKHTWK